MNVSTSPCALFLCPAQQDFTVDDLTQFVTQLQRDGFIGKVVTDKENSFYTGEQYLDLIAYLGCSPAIRFEADSSGNNFCQIKIHRYETAKLIVSRTQARAPHCPNCNKPVKDWPSHKIQQTIHCESCNTTSGIGNFNWRKMAGYARVFIEITDIYPKEAIPQQILLDTLASNTDVEWKYFYHCQ